MTNLSKMLANTLVGQRFADPFTRRHVISCSVWARSLAEVGELNLPFKCTTIHLPHPFGQPKCEADANEARPRFDEEHNQWLYPLLVDALTARYIAHYKLRLDCHFARDKNTNFLVVAGVYVPEDLPLTFEQWLQDQQEESMYRERLKKMRGDDNEEGEAEVK